MADTTQTGTILDRIVADKREGVRIAVESIDSGAARERLDAMVRVSNEVE